MTETQSKILKVLGEYGQIKEAQLGSENARSAMRDLIDSGYVLFLDAEKVAMVRAMKEASFNEFNSWAYEIEQEALQHLNHYVLTMKGSSYLFHLGREFEHVVCNSAADWLVTTLS